MVDRRTARWVRWSVWLIGILMVVSIAICIWQYPIAYKFFTQTISDLGAINSYTYNGLEPVKDVLNPISQWIFSAGLIAIALSTVSSVVIYFSNSCFYATRTKAALMITLAVGALGTAFPWDFRFEFIHALGTFLFVGSFGAYNFVSQCLRYLRKHEHVPSRFGGVADLVVDFIVVFAIFAILIWYLSSGLLGLLHVSKIGWLVIFATGLAQKCLLIACITAMFLLDLDDV